MGILRYGEQTIVTQEGESVLESLLRAGVPAAHSCRTGVCQSCLMRATVGAPAPEGQQPLKDAMRMRGYFLACVTPATGDLTISTDDSDGLCVQATVCQTTMLTPTILRLRLMPERELPYRAGQFIHIVRPDGLTRSYSLASVPGRDPFMELHVRLIEGGRMSTWLRTQGSGDRMTLRGPAGDCFYVPGRSEQPILLVGVGTGLAPLYGVVRDALRQEHSGPLVILHGARALSELYYVDELRALAAAHSNVTYLPCVLESPAERPADLFVGPLPELLAQRHPKLSGWRAYLCGDPVLVHSLRRQVFLAGAARRDIAADAFVTAPNLVR